MRKVPKDEIESEYTEDDLDTLDLKMGDVVEDHDVYYWERKIDYKIDISTIDKMYKNGKLGKEAWKEVHRHSGMPLNDFIGKFQDYKKEEETPTTNYYIVNLSYTEFLLVEDPNYEPVEGEEPLMVRDVIGIKSDSIIFHTHVEVTTDMLHEFLTSDYEIDEIIIHDMCMVTESVCNFLKQSNTTIRYVGKPNNNG